MAISIFWMFAINGYPAGSQFNGIMLNALIVAFFAYFVANYSNPIFKSQLRLGLNAPIILALIAVVAASWSHLNQDLWSDEIYHSSLSVRHAQLLIFSVKAQIPSLWPLIADLPVQWVIQAINATILLFLLIIFFAIPRLLKSRPYVLAALLVVVLLVVRSGMSSTDNIFRPLGAPVFYQADFGLDAHPLLRLFPLFISSALFGPTPLGFRLAGFLMYLLFLLLLFQLLTKKSPAAISGLAVAAIGTIPILWHVSYLVEASIWAALATSGIFAALYASESDEKVSLTPLLALAVLATLARVPAFLALIPIGFFLCWRLLRGRIATIEFVPIIALLGLCAVSVAVASARGTPATVTNDVLSHALKAATDNIPAVATGLIVGALPLFFIGFALSGRTVYRLVLAVSIIVFFVACNFVYYGPIHEVLWGMSRYQAEMMVPLITAGVVALAVDTFRMRMDESADSFSRAARLSLVTFLLSCLIITNVYSILTLDQKSFRPLNHPPPDEPFKAEIEYPQRQAFELVANRGLQTRTYFVGVYYGGFIAALNGYSVNNYAAFSALNLGNRAGWVVNGKALDAERLIDAVIIEPEADTGVAADLQGLGWDRHEIVHKRSAKRLIVFIRPPT